MQIRVIVLPGGKLQIFCDEGTYDEAVAATEGLLARFKAAGVPVDLTSGIESHRDGGSHAHVIRQVHEGH